MTAVLVSLPDQLDFLGGDVPATEEPIVQAIIDHVEDLFLKQTNRHERPFLATTDTTARVEVKDGTGSDVLLLDYNISALATDITLGRDTADLDETLTYNDVDEVVWVAGKRMIQRTDGGVWGAAGSPRYVRVTYKAAADLPEMPQLAIKRIVAQIYRQRGSEDASTESVGGFYSRSMAKFGREFVDDDPIWLFAVRSEWEPRI